MVFYRGSSFKGSSLNALQSVCTLFVQSRDTSKSETLKSSSQTDGLSNWSWHIAAFFSVQV